MERLGPWLQEFGLGCCLGGMLDRVHIRFKIISYDGSPTNRWCGQPMWVPPLFGASAVAFGFLSRFFPVRMRRAMTILFVLRSDLVWFVVSYLLSACKFLLPIERATILCLLFAYRATSHRDNLNLYCLVCAIVGCCVESVLIRKKFFRHTEIDWMQLPAWLPFLYMHAAPFIHTLHLFLRTPPLAS